jgi:hypothetical protein
MKITLISLDNWGFNNHIAKKLIENGHVVHHIDFNSFLYKYPSFNIKIINFFYKIFSGRNLKNIYYGKEILKRLQKINEKQDVILIIKSDFIDPKYLIEFKKYTKTLTGFFNDNSKRYPKTKTVLSCFDNVYSFEKEDCEKYNLPFLTNWIYNEDKKNTKTEYNLFNISSKDKRLPFLQKIGAQLKAKNISFKIMVFDKKHNDNSSTIEFITSKYSLEEVSGFISKSKTLLDINRPGQSGLTFRVFESLGLEKKLITNNEDIVNYDFYNPQNILVINEKNLEIDTAFFETEYQKLPNAIYYKYSLNGWIDQIIFNKKL